MSIFWITASQEIIQLILAKQLFFLFFLNKTNKTRNERDIVSFISLPFLKTASSDLGAVLSLSFYSNILEDILDIHGI